MCQRLDERANIRRSFTVSPFTSAPFVWWFMRTRPLAARIMLTSFDSRLNESARIFEEAGGSFGRASISMPDSISRAMWPDDPLARTYARRLHAIRLRCQSHPLPPVWYSHQVSPDHAKQADRLPVLHVFSILLPTVSSSRPSYFYFSHWLCHATTCRDHNHLYNCKNHSLECFEDYTSRK